MPLCLLLALFAMMGQEPIESLGSWGGVVTDERLKGLAEGRDAIVDGDEFAELWKGWRGDEPIPQIDFKEELVLVAVADGPNRVAMTPRMGEGGDLKTDAVATLIGGPGFGYQLMRVSRGGIKTINGKSIDRGIRGRVIIPAAVAGFEGRTLELQLWEYDPRLADVSATLIDKRLVEGYTHVSGEATETPFRLAAKYEPRADRKYYLTCFVLRGDERTHIGERDGESGLATIGMRGENVSRWDETSVKMIVRAVQ